MTTRNTTPPAEPGLFIARAFDRSRAREDDHPGKFGPYVRFWTGKHWTPPTAVADLNIPGRVPDASWPVARDEAGRVRCVEWLEPFTLPSAIGHCVSEAHDAQR